jgi:3-oxoacyl-[acyl-carrier-protein] synthase-3
MNVFIKAIEYYLPSKIVTNEELEKEFPEWNAEKVSQKIGIKERHIVDKNETATDLAFKVATKLFDNNPTIKETVDFLLLCSQSTDYKLPTSACILQDRLGLPTTIGAFDFDLGCSGFIYGLAIAKGLVCAGIAKNVLLITAETYSKYFHPKDKGNRSLFGDGAAATLISTEGFARIGELVLGTDGRGEDNLKVKTGGARYPCSLNEESLDDNGYILSSDYLYMNGPEIFNFTLDSVPPLMDECILRNNLKKEDIDLFVPHQANQYMLNTIRKVYVIPKDKFYISLEKTGNTVSSTIPIALKDIYDQKLISKGSKVLTAGFGVGYSYGASVLFF